MENANFRLCIEEVALKTKVNRAQVLKKSYKESYRKDDVRQCTNNEIQKLSHLLTIRALEILVLFCQIN